MDSKTLTRLFKTVATVSDYMPMKDKFSIINNDHTILLEVDIQDDILDFPGFEVDVKKASKIKLPKGNIALAKDNDERGWIYAFDGTRLLLNYIKTDRKDFELKKRPDYGEPKNKIELNVKALKELVKTVDCTDIGLKDDQNGNVTGSLYDYPICDELVAQNVVGSDYTDYNFESIYDVKMLKSILKLLPDKVEARINTNFPIELYWTDEEVSYKYMIAPKILTK